MPSAPRHFQQRLERLEVLHRISDIINTTLEPRRVLNMLLREVVRITRATSGSIAMLDARQGVLDIETAINIDPKVWKRLKLPLGVGVTGYVAWSGRPLRTGDVRGDPHYVPLKRNVRSELAVPMIVGGRVIGVINVDSEREDAFTGADEELCMEVAQQSARVLETVRLHETVRRHAEELESLFAVGRTLIEPGPLDQLLDRLVREGLSLLDGGRCVLLEPRGDALVVLAAAGAGEEPLLEDDGAAREMLLDCAREQRAFTTAPPAEEAPADPTTLPPALAAVPVTYGGEVRAVLAVFSATRRTFRDSELKLLQLLANQGALAMENARRMERLASLEESLRHAGRLSLLGTLSAEIAHEIRNPVTIISMLIHGMQENPALDARTRDDLALVTEKLGRINALVERTLGLAKTTETRPQPTPPNRVVEDLLLFLQPKLGKSRIAVTCALQVGLPDVAADEGQLQQVLLNLILNAVQAMEDGGALTLRTRRARDRELGECAQFIVEDTGPGIEEEHLPRLFEPFFSRRDGGAGLGLFVSHKIVTRHGGSIRVGSRAGGGCRVTVSLPLHADSAPPDAP